MNPASRGVRNAFRNPTRTVAITIIIGLTIGLSLTMLIAQKAVDSKIKSVKASVGNTITIAPAGFNPGSQTNNALTTTELAKVKALSHVSELDETLTDRLSTTGSTTQIFGRQGGQASASTSTTSLTSPVTISANGPRFSQGGISDTGSTTATAFSLPISFLGTTNTNIVDSTTVTIKNGKTISGTTDTNNVLISSTMATKNNLAVGSTFTAYNATLTVVGIFTSSTQGTNNTVVMSLASLQRLSGETNTVTSAVATVDSLDNLSATTTAVKSALGSSTADVTSAQQEADSTVAPLNSVKTVSTYSLIGALVAGAVIILLTMIMVVRERKKEIGVVKAIGGSNARIAIEFMIESITLSVIGAIIGLVLGVIAGQPVTKALVSNSTSSTTTTATTTQAGRGGFGGNNGGSGTGGGFGGGVRRNSAVKSLGNIKTQIGPSVLLEGFGAAVFIAVIGSTLAAAMISKVRPSTVMRAE